MLAWTIPRPPTITANADQPTNPSSPSGAAWQTIHAAVCRWGSVSRWLSYLQILPLGIHPGVKHADNDGKGRGQYPRQIGNIKNQIEMWEKGGSFQTKFDITM